LVMAMPRALVTSGWPGGCRSTSPPPGARTRPAPHSSTYRVFDDTTVVTVSRLFPVVDVEESTVSPQRQQLQAAEERRRTTRERSTVQRLVAAGSIPDGTPLRLRPTTEVTSEVRATIDEWVNSGRGLRPFAATCHG
jgi:hypothetical protein